MIELSPQKSKRQDGVSHIQQRLFKASTQLHLVSQKDNKRTDTEKFIAEKFKQQYNAQLYHYLPKILCLNCDNELSGAVGIQSATYSTLFLEQYIDGCAEQKMSEKLLRPIDRSHIVEIGNLVSRRQGSTYLIFTSTAEILYKAGYQWLMFTATEQIENIIKKMGVTPIPICQAEQQLIDNQQQWGSYYQGRPRVMATNLKLCHDLICQTPLLKNIADRHRQDINDIAESLSGEHHGK